MKKLNVTFWLGTLIALGLISANIAFAQAFQATAKEKGNATSSSINSQNERNQVRTETQLRSEERKTISTTSTTSQNEQNQVRTEAKLRSEEHRSEVAKFVQTLLERSDRLGGIGEEVRVIARAQSSTTKETVDAIKAIENRSGLTKLLVGSDYKNIGKVRSEIASTTNRLAQLERELAKAGDTSDTTAIQAEIQAIKDENVKLETFLKANEGSFSLFGWFVRMFQ